MAAATMETVLIKKPNMQESYTEQQIAEIIRCADPATGPQYFLALLLPSVDLADRLVETRTRQVWHKTLYFYREPVL